jgi:fumarylacetoacetase
MIQANNPSLQSWVTIPDNCDFPIQNLPFGVFSTDNAASRIGVAIGDDVLDLYEIALAGLLNEIENDASVFKHQYLNPIIEKGKGYSRALRNKLSEILEASNPVLRDNAELRKKALIPMSEVNMHLPINVGDYTDFYSSIDHATNVGKMFRDPANALLPNWLHIPVGYHGRASSIIPSGTPIKRPVGQVRPDPEKPPVLAPTRLLDFELEMAFVTFPGKPLGERILIDEAEDYIFGVCLFNDWSARDIQKWEYVPLGPFLGKSFASAISPWIVTLDALDPFRLDGPEQNPEALDYLKYKGKKRYDINLEVYLQPENKKPTLISQSNFKHMYWNMCQQLTHHTVNGCNIKGGDMMGSGTISGPTPDSYGSMLELSWAGSKTVVLDDGSERKFIQDGDTVIMKGWSKKDNVRIGFGEVSNKILPADF